MSIKRNLQIMFLVIVALIIVGISCADFDAWNVNPAHRTLKIVNKEDDGIISTIQAISHQGKLVVTDANITTRASSRYDSSIFDASLTTTQSARIQVYLDLSDLNPSWFVLTGKSLIISIPYAEMKTEVIPGQTSYTFYDSWAFTFYSGLKQQLTDNNNPIIHSQLQSEAEYHRSESREVLEKEITNLFRSALEKHGYTIQTKVVGTV